MSKTSYEIRATAGLFSDIGEVWHYRQLVAVLAWSQFKVRYKQSVLGLAWALIDPFFSMVVFTVIFGGLIQVDTQGIPYAIFSFAALVPWTYFSTALVNVTTSITSNQNLITKVYFPRLTLPLVASLSRLLDMGVSFSFLLVLMVIYGITPTIGVLFLPFYLGLAILSALTFGVFLAVLNVRYRDIGVGINIVVRLLIYASPVAYSIQLVPIEWRWLYSLNPITVVVEGFRWAILGTEPIALNLTLASTLVILTLLVISLAYFQSAQRNFVDSL